jgi:hypothetical protein
MTWSPTFFLPWRGQPRMRNSLNTILFSRKIVAMMMQVNFFRKISGA